jgi:serine protease inhibitor
VQYQASINQADFTTQADAATAEISSWVAQETQNKIQDILSPGILDRLTQLVLVNAIYFKGLWAKPFEVTDTSAQPFHLSSTNQVDVPLMHQPVDLVNYMETAEFQAIELPYGSNQASMLIDLPRLIDGLEQLEQQLFSGPHFRRACANARAERRDLPAFHLNDSLAIMGIAGCLLARCGGLLGD